MRFKILIFDENPDTLKTLGKIFSDRYPDWDISLVDDHDKTKSMIVANHFDITILDFAGDDNKSAKLLEVWKKNKTKNKFEVVILTGPCDQAMRHKAMKSGAVDLICRPFNKSELLARIESIIFLKEHHKFLFKETQVLKKLNDRLTAEIDLRYKAEEKLVSTNDKLKENNELLKKLAIMIKDILFLSTKLKILSL